MSQPPWDTPGAHPVVEAVAQIEAALDGCVHAPLWSLSSQELLELLPRLQAIESRLIGSLVLPVTEQARANGAAERAGAPGLRHWIAQTLRVGNGAAKTSVDLARKLANNLPTTAAVFAEGAIAQAHARAIAAAVDKIPDTLGQEVTSRLGPARMDSLKHEAEAFLAEHARDLTPGEVAQLGAAVLEHVAPEVAEELERKKREHDEKNAVAARMLRGTSHGDRIKINGWMDVEGWETITTALAPLAGQRPADAGGEPDLRGKDRRRADALIELCRRALGSGDLPEQGGEKPQVVVTIDFDKLKSKLGGATLPDGQQISAASARRLACDAAILPAVLGGQGQVLDLGRSRRLFTGAVRKALELRDRGCSFPHACNTPPAQCQSHHIVPWEDGGATSVSNGTLTCNGAHWLVHHAGWTARIAPDGICEWVPPAWLDAQRTPRRHTRFLRSNVRRPPNSDDLDRSSDSVARAPP